MKDPAFLFYSKDFYEGTRIMLPEERACYIDLMIYQHQNEFIPNDIKRLLLYCTGIDKATLEATLEAKFRLCDKGWYNQKLVNVVTQRQEFSNKQSINGKVGQFWKKAKSLLNKKDYSELRELLENKTNNEIYSLIEQKDINIETLKDLLEALPKQFTIATTIVNKEQDITEYDNKDRKNNWKSSFEIYLNEMNTTYDEIIHDKNFIQEQEKFHPGIDILLSLEKAKTNFWGTEAGWQNKKKSRAKEINWKLTFVHAIEMNKVYKPRNGTYQADNNRPKDYSLKR